MKIAKRLERIKQIPFYEVVRAIAVENGIDLPEPNGRNRRCVLPGHADKTASFSLRVHGFRCFGCGVHGDAMDFLMAVEGLEWVEALARLETMLGMGSPEEGLLALAKRRVNAQVEAERKKRDHWRAEMTALESVFLTRIRPYLLSPDPVIVGIAEPKSQWVFDEFLDEMALEPGQTERGRRERLRDLRVWSAGIAGGIEREVQRVTGRDRLDVRLCGRPRWPASKLAHKLAAKLLEKLEPRGVGLDHVFRWWGGPVGVWEVIAFTSALVSRASHRFATTQNDTET